MSKIEVTNIRHVYGSGEEVTVAIKRLDLTLEDGTANALLGPSGCGKTTLLEIISGLLTPTEGQVLIDGRDVTDESPEQRDIAQVFQFPIVYDSMSVYGNLAFPLRNEGVPEDEVERRVQRVADILELNDFLEDNPTQFGPERRQLVALGRGIVRENTSALLFDEPMTDVEPSRKLVIRRRIKEAQEEFGITALYVTHDQHEALTFADRVAIMRDGKIVQYDTGPNLYHRPVNTFIGHFIGSPGMNILDAELKENGEIQGILGTYPVELSEAVRPKLDSQWEDVKLGFRPSIVEVQISEPEADKGWIPLDVTLVEMLEGFQIVTGLVEATQIEIKARCSHDLNVNEEDRVWIHLPPEGITVFHEERAVKANQSHGETETVET